MTIPGLAEGAAGSLCPPAGAMRMRQSDAALPAAALRWARRLKRVLLDRAGQGLLEMAVAVPTFLLLLFGSFAISIMMFEYENAAFACRVAARFASLHSSTSKAPTSLTAVTGVVQQFLWAAPSSTTVRVTWSAGNTIGGTVTVTVSSVYPTGIPFSQLSTVTMTNSAQRTIMR